MLISNYEGIPELSLKAGLLDCQAPWVAARLDFDCAPKGGFVGVPVNGRRVAFPENVFYEFRGGTIATVWSVVETAEIDDQLDAKEAADPWRRRPRRWRGWACGLPRGRRRRAGAAIAWGSAMKLSSATTVVLTGASSGIGHATALAFAREGVSLVLAARDADALGWVAETCRHLGARAAAVPTDVTEPEQVRALAVSAIQIYGGIDVWINNVGTGAVGQFERVPLRAHQRVIEANLLGHLYGAYAVLPYFRQRRRGVLINMISVGGWVPTPYAASYAASKFGLRGLSESLRAEVADMPGIAVCEVYPSFVDTPGVSHGANYTGKHLRPPPPMLDPREVAAALVRLARAPRASTMIGRLAWPARLAHTVSPDLSARMTRYAMNAGLRAARPAAPTDGNLFKPSHGHGIDGGLRHEATRARKRRLAQAGALAAMALALWRLRR